VTNAKEPKVELFFIYDKPMSFYKVTDPADTKNTVQAVWAEALRLCFKKAGVADLNDPKAISAKVTKYCHTDHGMVYDTIGGASWFNTDYDGKPFVRRKDPLQYNRVVKGFRLWEYMKKRSSDSTLPNNDYNVPPNTVNCYDSAAAVQALSGALGVAVTWIFQEPFGYINATMLVGVADPCNNPFFKGAGAKPLEPLDSDHRYQFGNHAYTAASTPKNDIRDACAGPHIGSETNTAYLKASIDIERYIDDVIKYLKSPKHSDTLDASRIRATHIFEDWGKDFIKKYNHDSPPHNGAFFTKEEEKIRRDIFRDKAWDYLIIKTASKTGIVDVE
jgi:hypothetical protein